MINIYAIYMYSKRRIRGYINVRKGIYVYCMLHENHFAGRCNLSPNTRIIAAMCCALSKLFPCVNERWPKIYRVSRS